MIESRVPLEHLQRHHCLMRTFVCENHGLSGLPSAVTHATVLNRSLPSGKLSNRHILVHFNSQEGHPSKNPRDIVDFNVLAGSWNHISWAQSYFVSAGRRRLRTSQTVHPWYTWKLGTIWDAMGKLGFHAFLNPLLPCIWE